MGVLTGSTRYILFPFFFLYDILKEIQLVIQIKTNENIILFIIVLPNCVNDPL